MKIRIRTEVTIWSANNGNIYRTGWVFVWKDVDIIHTTHIEIPSYCGQEFAEKAVADGRNKMLGMLRALGFDPSIEPLRIQDYRNNKVSA